MSYSFMLNGVQVVVFNRFLELLFLLPKNVFL